MSGLLYLFRHGQAAPPWILLGRADYPLSPLGERQADWWGKTLSDVAFDIAWASPLLRAGQTAARILSGNPANARTVLPAPALAEICLGAWEGKSKDWIRRAYPAAWEARGRDFVHVPPPGGESFLDLAARVLPAFSTLCSEAAGCARSLLVAHQAVNRVILAKVLNLPLPQALSLPQPPGALSVLTVTTTGALLVERRDVPDLTSGSEETPVHFCKRNSSCPR